MSNPEQDANQSSSVEPTWGTWRKETPKELENIGKSGKEPTSTKRKPRQLTDMDDVIFAINPSQQLTWTKE